MPLLFLLTLCWPSYLPLDFEKFCFSSVLPSCLPCFLIYMFILSSLPAVHSSQATWSGTPRPEDSSARTWYPYMPREARRFRRMNLRVKYPLPTLFLIGEARCSWEKGQGMTAKDLADRVRDTFDVADSEDAAFQEQHFKPSSPQNSFTVWVWRTLKSAGFTERKKAMGQYIPQGWDKLAALCAAAVRSFFHARNIDALVAADETFIRFGCRQDSVVAPMGSARIGTTDVTNDKGGCTLMLAMEFFSSRVLRPTLIFAGTIGGDLYHRYRRRRSPISCSASLSPLSPCQHFSLSFSLSPSVAAFSCFCCFYSVFSCFTYLSCVSSVSFLSYLPSLSYSSSAF
eukprot:GHVU01084274.1.p1 GENE.GHVU01084274.1~~GHVU01084274.1.p1  ORF type:complete len:342 (+),score=20.62 GHVU01084274.1:603-1628(+)